MILPRKFEPSYIGQLVLIVRKKKMSGKATSFVIAAVASSSEVYLMKANAVRPAPIKVNR